MSREDLERVMFFQSAKEDASKAVQRNPRDATAHTQLGGALLELSHFQQGSDSFAMIQEARHYKHMLCFYYVLPLIDYKIKWMLGLARLTEAQYMRSEYNSNA